MSAAIQNWPQAAVAIVAIVGGTVCLCIFVWRMLD